MSSSPAGTARGDAGRKPASYDGWEAIKVTMISVAEFWDWFAAHEEELFIIISD